VLQLQSCLSKRHEVGPHRDLCDLCFATLKVNIIRVAVKCHTCFSSVDQRECRASGLTYILQAANCESCYLRRAKHAKIQQEFYSVPEQNVSLPETVDVKIF
jgi:hypothetical protein